jgi:predicted Rossmann fold nucleotide-binding protein DprA/Smf involved in DNA uptake
MDRNKFIYCLADYAVVVASGQESGGTWAGAVDDLKEGWVPLFVRAEGRYEGNALLIARGGIALDPAALPDEDNLESWLGAQAAAHSAVHAEQQQRSLPETVGTSAEPVPGERHAASTDAVQTEQPEPMVNAQPPADLFPVVWPYLDSYLSEPRAASDVATVFTRQLPQARAWLDKAVGQGLASASGRPRMYRRVASTPEQSELFTDSAPDRDTPSPTSRPAVPRHSRV